MNFSHNEAGSEILAKISDRSSLSNGNVICWLRDRVDEAMPEDETVYHVLTNSGADCRWITADLDGDAVKIAQEADMEASQGLLYLAYAFKKQTSEEFRSSRLNLSRKRGFQAAISI